MSPILPVRLRVPIITLSGSDSGTLMSLQCSMPSLRGSPFGLSPASSCQASSSSICPHFRKSEPSVSASLALLLETLLLTKRRRFQVPASIHALLPSASEQRAGSRTTLSSDTSFWPKLPCLFPHDLLCTVKYSAPHPSITPVCARAGRVFQKTTASLLQTPCV